MIANMIAESTGGELFKVETVTPYPEDYNETVDIALEEQDTDARPELSTHVENMEQYDTIFLNRDLNNMIVPLFFEQLLVLLVGIMDTFVVSFAGEAAISGVSMVNQFNTISIGNPM